MGDELIAGPANLVGMAVAGELEGPRDGLTVDLRRRVELLDDGEEVGEELSLL
jgi:hypothetical protein